MISDYRIIVYKQFHVGSARCLSDRHLEMLTRAFDRPRGQAEHALGGRSAISRISLDGIGPAVVKYYTRGGILGSINRRFYLKAGRTRGEIEWRFLNRMRHIGVRAPEPIAFAWYGRMVYRGWLVTREITDHLTLAQLSRSQGNRIDRALKDLAPQIQRLIANRIHHVDLHPGNVLVDPTGYTYIIDFDKCRFTNKSTAMLKSIYTRRWNRAIVKHGLPPELIKWFDRQLF